VGAATFEAEGCGVTIACGSVLTELLKGRGFVECNQIEKDQAAQALDGIPGENTAYRNLPVARCPRELAEVLEKRS
jgi:NifU-like protein involved in Fe-S cluster formation